ncbi:MAG TPA: LemA family protein [Candidatus Baltobacteraceae bacterium]
MNRRPSYAGWIAVAIVLVLIVYVMTSYNGLIASEQAVDAQWGQVQNVYQRRADLVPNLVATVKGAANFEKSTYIAVAQARASVGQITPQALQGALNDPKTFAQYQSAQNSLGATLSRLLVVTENYPTLQANQDFLTLQSQLEGTENRIAVERKRFNDLAQAFNTRRNTMPTALVANFFGAKFADKPYFSATSQAQTVPKVQF